jgi:hypothetical protein
MGELAPVVALLDAAEGQPRIQAYMLIDEDHPGVDELGAMCSPWARSRVNTPQIRPLAGERPVEKRMHSGVTSDGCHTPLELPALNARASPPRSAPLRRYEIAASNEPQPATAPGLPGAVARPYVRERLTGRIGFGNAAALSTSRRSGFDGDGSYPMMQPAGEALSTPPWALID